MTSLSNDDIGYNFDEYANAISKLDYDAATFIYKFEGGSLKKTAKDIGMKLTRLSALLSDKTFITALDQRRRFLCRLHGLHPSDVLLYWQRVMDDEDEETRDRLNASKLLAQFHSLLKPEQVQQQANIQIILPASQPDDPAHIQEVNRLKRALPAANIEIDHKIQPAEEKPAPLTQEDIQQRLHALHAAQELQDIL